MNNQSLNNPRPHVIYKKYIGSNPHVGESHNVVYRDHPIIGN